MCGFAVEKLQSTLAKLKLCDRVRLINCYRFARYRNNKIPEPYTIALFQLLYRRSAKGGFVFHGKGKGCSDSEGCTALDNVGRGTPGVPVVQTGRRGACLFRSNRSLNPAHSDHMYRSLPTSSRSEATPVL